MPKVKHMRSVDPTAPVSIVMMGGMEGQIYLLGTVEETARKFNASSERLVEFEAIFSGEDTPQVSPVYISADIVAVVIGETTAGEAHKSLTSSVEVVFPGASAEFPQPAAKKSRLQ